MKRIFLIVLDSFGVGELPDAADYGDEGSNTLGTVCKNKFFSMPNMTDMGLFNLDGIKGVCGDGAASPTGAYCRLREASAGKDTTTGHWEIAGLVSEKHLPLFPDGFPDEIIKKFEDMTGRKVLVNKPYSGTEVIKDYGEEHMRTGALIVYTSADSVFQVAAHEDVVPVEQLYEYCQMARDMLVGDYGVGRVIARPFVGKPGDFTRTSRRHDFSLVPPGDTMLDELMAAGYATIGVGKINDIFAGKGISEFVRTSGNPEGIERTLEYMDRDFTGLCFVNLVDFDMLYGHRNDADGYAKALTYFDARLPEIVAKLGPDDILMITADHGCDPGTPSTDHSREYIPLIMYGQNVPAGTNLGTRPTYADIGSTVLRYFAVPSHIAGESLLTF